MPNRDNPGPSELRVVQPEDARAPLEGWAEYDRLVSGGGASDAATGRLAARMVDFYAALITVHIKVLAAMDELASRLPEEHARAAELDDLGPIRETIADFARRRGQWQILAEACRVPAAPSAPPEGPR